MSRRSSPLRARRRQLQYHIAVALARARGRLRPPFFVRPLSLVESVFTDYFPAIEFRPDDLASRALRVGLTTFFQNLDLYHTWLRGSSGRP